MLLAKISATLYWGLETLTEIMSILPVGSRVTLPSKNRKAPQKEFTRIFIVPAFIEKTGPT